MKAGAPCSRGLLTQVRGCRPRPGGMLSGASPCWMTLAYVLRRLLREAWVEHIVVCSPPLILQLPAYPTPAATPAAPTPAASEATLHCTRACLHKSPGGPRYLLGNPPICSAVRSLCVMIAIIIISVVVVAAAAPARIL